MQRDFTAVLGILPFETAFFTRHGVNYTYVGTPQLDRVRKVNVTKADLGWGSGRLVACLPGSRLAEIHLHMDILLQASALVAAQCPDVQFVIPVATNLQNEDFDPYLQKIAETLRQRFHLLKGASLEVMAAADAALVASGTATLECALLRTPMVVFYRMSDATYQMAKKKVQISQFSLVNIIAEKTVVKELIQDIDPRLLAARLIELLTEGSAARQTMLKDFDDLAKRLQPGAAAHAATLIADILAL